MMVGKRLYNLGSFVIDSNLAVKYITHIVASFVSIHAYSECSVDVKLFTHFLDLGRYGCPQDISDGIPPIYINCHPKGF